jgi:hypothetical protein
VNIRVRVNADCDDHLAIQDSHPLLVMGTNRHAAAMNNTRMKDEPRLLIRSLLSGHYATPSRAQLGDPGKPTVDQFQDTQPVRTRVRPAAGNTVNRILVRTFFTTIKGTPSARHSRCGRIS